MALKQKKNKKTIFRFLTVYIQNIIFPSSSHTYSKLSTEATCLKLQVTIIKNRLKIKEFFTTACICEDEIFTLTFYLYIYVNV